MMRYVLMLLCACLIFSCKSKNIDERSDVVKVTIGGENPDGRITDFFGLIDSIVIINLPDKGFLLGSIIDARFTKDRIYVLDVSANNKALYVYDSTGNPLFRVGMQGRGPGEYINLEDFFVTSEHIIILDDSFCKMLVYDINGNFQYSTETDAYEAGLVNDNIIAEHDGAGKITLRNIKGDILREFHLDFQGIQSVFTGSFSYQNENLDFLDKINQRIYRITPDSLAEYRCISLGEWQVPPDYYRSFSGKAPNNVYTNVYQKTHLTTNYGLLTRYVENLSWEYYRFEIKMLPRHAYRHKASGKLFQSGFSIWQENHDKGFESLGVAGAVATVGDFFIIPVSPGMISEFIKNDDVADPMLIELRERLRNLEISEYGNSSLLLYRLKYPVDV